MGHARGGELFPDNKVHRDNMGPIWEHIVLQCYMQN